MIESERQPATDRMAVTADPLQSVRKASADYCAKMTTLQKANQGVPNPVGVVTSLLPGAITEAKKDAARCVREFEGIVADAALVAEGAVKTLRDFERRVEAIRKAGAELVKSFGDRVEKDQDAVVKGSELSEELRGAREAVVNLECVLGAGAAFVSRALEAVTHSLESLADGGWGSDREATRND